MHWRMFSRFSRRRRGSGLKGKSSMSDPTPKWNERKKRHPALQALPARRPRESINNKQSRKNLPSKDTLANWPLRNSAAYFDIKLCPQQVVEWKQWSRNGDDVVRKSFQLSFFLSVSFSSFCLQATLQILIHFFIIRKRENFCVRRTIIRIYLRLIFILVATHHGSQSVATNSSNIVFSVNRW